MKDNRKITYLEVGEMIDLVDRMSCKRDKLIALLLYETGCSISELIEIKKKDIKSRTNEIIIENSNRTNEKRIAKISKNLLTLIKEFLEENNTNSKFLLSTRQSESMTQKRVQQIISTYKTKNKEKITPQILRYTHIAHAYSSGVDIANITKQVGLKRSRTIEIFSQLKTETNGYNKFLEHTISEK